MKELIASGKATMSSREIAELTGKQHKHVLVDCDKLNEGYANLGMAEISAMNYKADNGQIYREFALTKMQTMDLMTGYNLELRIRVNRRWEELETQANQFNPTALSRMDILRIAMEAEEHLEAERTRNKLLAQEVEKKEAIIEHLEPKASLADRLMQSSSTVDVRTFAGLINRQPNNFFETLRQDGFLISFGERRNQPIAKYNGKYFKTEAKTWIEKKSRKACTFVQTRITGPGMLFLFKKYVHDADKNKVGPILLDFLSNQKQSNHDHHFNSNSKGYIDASLGDTR